MITDTENVLGYPKRVVCIVAPSQKGRKRKKITKPVLLGNPGACFVLFNKGQKMTNVSIEVFPKTGPIPFSSYSHLPLAYGFGREPPHDLGGIKTFEDVMSSPSVHNLSKYDWIPNPPKDPSKCRKLTPFYKDDFCETFKGKSIVVIGDSINRQLQVDFTLSSTSSLLSDNSPFSLNNVGNKCKTTFDSSLPQTKVTKPNRMFYARKQNKTYHFVM